MTRGTGGDGGGRSRRPRQVVDFPVTPAAVCATSRFQHEAFKMPSLANLNSPKTSRLHLASGPTTTTLYHVQAGLAAIGSWRVSGIVNYHLVHILLR